MATRINTEGGTLRTSLTLETSLRFDSQTLLSIDSSYTLIVPTYNRPSHLLRLVRYLCSFNRSFRVLILDSSSSEIQECNKRGLDPYSDKVEHIPFDSATDPISKYEHGISLVETPFCSFCADDDILLVDSATLCLEFLRSHPDYVAAHGYYFNFLPRDEVEIQALTYWRDSLRAEAPLERVVALMQDYEALFYAIYRTDVIRAIFPQSRRVDTFLWKELILAAASVLSGKIARLPQFYYGRCTGPSHRFENWHPHEILAKSPEVLISDFAKYRAALFKQFAINEGPDGEARARAFDLAHLAYIAPFLQPEIINYILDRTLAGDDSAAIIAGIWDRWVHSPQPKTPVRRYRPGRRHDWLTLIRKAWHRLFPGLRFSLYYDDVVTSRSPDAPPRRYRLSSNFLALRTPGAIAPAVRDVRMIIDNLDRYLSLKH